MHTYRSDVVGSLLRPPYLKDTRQHYEAGESSAVEFKKVEDRAVDEAVALQIRAGVDVLSDGELRRYAFFGHLIDAVEGFDKFGGWALPFRDEQGNELVVRRPVVVSRLRRRRHLCAEEFTYLRARTDRPAKAMLISFWPPQEMPRDTQDHTDEDTGSRNQPGLSVTPAKWSRGLPRSSTF